MFMPPAIGITRNTFGGRSPAVGQEPHLFLRLAVGRLSLELP